MEKRKSNGEYKETEIGPIPKDWDVVRLGDYCKVLGGFAFKSEDYSKEGILIVKIGNLQKGALELNKESNFFPKSKIGDSLNKFILKKGDVLIALTGATTGKTAIVPENFEGSLLNQRVGKFEIFNSKLNSLFNRFYISTNEFQAGIKNNILQSAQGNVSPKQIENLKIPFPNALEQKNIALALFAVQQAKEKTEKLLHSLKELKKSTMKHLFTYGVMAVEDAENVKLKDTEIGKIPENWDIQKLGKLFEVQQGKQLSSKESIEGKIKLPFLRTSNLSWGRIDVSNIDYMYYTNDEINKLSLNVNDILVCEGGDVGRTALWNDELKGCLYQNHLHRLRPLKEDYDPLFFVLWMQHAILNKQLYIQSANRTTIPNLSSSRLKDFSLPKPQLSEQKQIASILLTIDSKIQTEEQKKEALEQLFKSLLRDLMSGKLRVNNLKIEVTNG